MRNTYDTGFLRWVSAVPSRKWVLLAAGGAFAASVGGYMIYSQCQKRRFSSDIPLDPDHDKNVHKSAEGVKKVDQLEECQRIKEQGNKFFRLSDYEKAVECYTEAINVCPAEQRTDLSILYQNRAATYEKLNDDTRAYEDCCKALEFNKLYVKALLRRANLLEKGARWREATRDYMKCCILQEFSVEDTARKTTKCMRKMSKEMAKEYLQKRQAEHRPVPLSKTVVRATLRSFGSDPILSRLNEIMRGSQPGTSRASGVPEPEPIDNESNYEVIENLVREQRFDEAISLCCEEIDLNSAPRLNLVKCLLLRSFLYNMTAKFSQVRADLDEALRILQLLTQDQADGSDSQMRKLNELMCSAYSMFGFVEHLEGNVDQSMHYLAQAEKICPDNADVYSLRGQIRSLNNVDVGLSIQDFSKAADLKPEFAHYTVQLLATEIKKASEDQDQVQIGRALERLRDLIHTNPNHVEANMFFAQAMLEMDNVPLAVKHLEHASKLDPTSADIVAQKAFIDMMNNRPDAALETVQKALDMDPYCLAALEIMAQYYSKRSDVPKMMECYDKALEATRSEAEAAHFFSMRETTLINMEMAEEMML